MSVIKQTNIWWIKYPFTWCWNPLISDWSAESPDWRSEIVSVFPAARFYPWNLCCDGISVYLLRLRKQTLKWWHATLESQAAKIMAGLPPPTLPFGQAGRHQISLWSDVLSTSWRHSRAHFLVSRAACDKKSRYTSFILKGFHCWCNEFVRLGSKACVFVCLCVCKVYLQISNYRHKMALIIC